MDRVVSLATVSVSARWEGAKTSCFKAADSEAQQFLLTFRVKCIVVLRALMGTHYPPSQFVVPSPANPGLQLHLKDPSSF